MIAADYEDREARALGRVVRDLMAEGMGYEDALIGACVLAPPGALVEGMRAGVERRIEKTLAEIARLDLAPLLPLAYDDYLERCIALVGGEDDSTSTRLAELARFPDEPDRGQPFVVRDGIVWVRS